MENGVKLKIQQRYFVSLPTNEAHEKVHPTGITGGMSQRVHPMISQKIEDLIKEGTVEPPNKGHFGFLSVRYEKRFSTDGFSREHAVCLLSGIEKCPLVGGYLYTSAILFSIGAIAGVLYREVVHWWEGLLWEVPLYYRCSRGETHVELITL